MGAGAVTLGQPSRSVETVWFPCVLSSPGWAPRVLRHIHVVMCSFTQPDRELGRVCRGDSNRLSSQPPLEAFCFTWSSPHACLSMERPN